MTAFFERTLESLRAGRLSGPLVRWVEAHPRLAAWFVLAVGMEPSVPKDAFPVEVVLNESGFIEADEKNGGIFAAGCSSDALDVNRAVQSATASALRAIQVVNRVAGTEG